MKKIALILPLFLFIPTVLAVVEYFPGENGQFIVRVEDVYGTPKNATCYVTILYPDKTIFLNQTMSQTQFGSFYVTFVVPNVSGVYEAHAFCNVKVCILPYVCYTRRLIKSGSFKVSPLLTRLEELENRLNSTAHYLEQLLQNATLEIVYNATVNITGNITNALTYVPDEVWKRYLELYPYIKEVTKTVDPSICVDNNTLLTYVNYTFCIGGDCRVVNYETYQHCDYGCDPALNRCIPPPHERYGLYVLLILGLIILGGIYYRWYA